MIIIDAQKIKWKDGINRMSWECSDGVTRTTKEVAEYIGMATATVLKRLHVYGIHPLITKKGPVSIEEHKAHKKFDHKQYNSKGKIVGPAVLKTRSGKVISPLGKYDSLVPCPPAATGTYVKDDSKEGPKIHDESCTMTILKLKRFNEKMRKKGLLHESGTLVNPRFPSGYQGRHTEGLPCNIL